MGTGSEPGLIFVVVVIVVRIHSSSFCVVNGTKMNRLKRIVVLEPSLTLLSSRLETPSAQLDATRRKFGGIINKPYSINQGERDAELLLPLTGTLFSVVPELG